MRAAIWKIICKVDQKKLDECKKHNFDTPEELYEHYRSKNTEHITYKIWKDLNRTDLDNHDFDPDQGIDHLKGENALFNILTAYAHFDPEIEYC